MKNTQIRSRDEAKSRLTKVIIWYVIAIVFCLIGLVIYLKNKNFSHWMIWGGLCCVPVLGTMLKFIFGMTRDGARDGANNYTVNVSDSSVSVSNHPFSTAIIYLILACIFSLIGGPIVLGINMIKNIAVIVSCARYLKQNQD